MKLIYGICGEGNGHGVRSLPLIQHLQKKHDVRVFAGDCAFPILQKCKHVRKTKSLRIIYRNNSVSNLSSFLYNIAFVPVHLVCFTRVFVEMLYFRPNIVVSDFEWFTNWSAFLLGIPVITVDNQQFIRTHIQIPAQTRLSYLKTRLVMLLISPHVTTALIPTISTTPSLKKNQVYAQPTLKQEVKHAKPLDKRTFFVYQTSDSNNELLELLQKLPHKFIVNGFHRKDVVGNCVFRTFDATRFVEDIRSCTAIITNGGFSLMTEALYLGKPVLSIPVKSQFEQELNASYLGKEGFGMSASKLTAEIMQEFVRKLPQFRKAIHEHNKQNKNVPTLLEALTAAIKKHERKA